MGIFGKNYLESTNVSANLALLGNSMQPLPPAINLKEYEIASQAVERMVDRLRSRSETLRHEIELATAELYETNKRLEALETAQSAYDQDTAEFQKAAREVISEEAA